MNQESILENTIKFVKNELQNAEGGHDWFHIERVYKNAILISKEESVDIFLVSLAALLHDIADAKFHKGDETVGPKKASDFLNRNFNNLSYWWNNVKKSKIYFSLKKELLPTSSNAFSLHKKIQQII